MSAPAAGLGEGLEALYRAYNRRRFVHPDPLELLYRFRSPEDQEIAGMVAACLAYGRVAQILASAGSVLDAMAARGDGGSPRAFLERATPAGIREMFSGFVHRFTTGAEMAAFLTGIRAAVLRHGSLRALFARGLARGQETALPALSAFVEELRARSGGPCASLLSSPDDGSACKRLNLFLRWMARSDAVDPGPWAGTLGREKLVVPLDTHLYRIARSLGLTARRQANLRTSLEITEGFRAYRPRDPVRYDFSLTRLGIRRGCEDGEPPAAELECALVEAARGYIPPR
jgi:uncharacterized protein (TIGR02757 family)